MNVLKVFLISLCLLSGLQSGCSHTIQGNEGGSQPINEKEVIQYKQAVLKCYKTGGTRVVKINGKLRCFN